MVIDVRSHAAGTGRGTFSNNRRLLAWRKENKSWEWITCQLRRAEGAVYLPGPHVEAVRTASRLASRRETWVAARIAYDMAW